MRLNSEIRKEISCTIEENIKVIAKKQCRNPTKENWILQAKPDIAKWFLKKQLVNFDLLMVHVEEHINLAVCFKCCGFGHVAKYCKQDECCHRCAGCHSAKECKEESLKCVNCQKMKYTDIAHSARDIEDFLEDHPECVAFCVTEHWKSKEQLQYHGISGYYLANSVCRNSGEHGGSAIFVKRGIKSVRHENISKLSRLGACECSVSEIKIGKDSIIVMSVYRPPSGNIDDFVVNMDEILSKFVNREKCKIFVAGDFNIHMHYENSHRLKLISLFNSYDLFHTIHDVTRINSYSATSIDNIFTNERDYEQTEVILNGISDHTAQKIVLNVTDCSERFIYKRIFGTKNKIRFRQQLQSQSWNDVYQCQEVNSAWNLFISHYFSHFNECFPAKKICINKKKAVLNSAKNDDAVKTCKETLNILYVVSNCDKKYKEQYIEQRKKYENLLKKAKADYFMKKIETSGNKSKCVWSLVNNIKGRHNECEIEVQGEGKTVANNLNEYFSSAAEKLVAGLDKFGFTCDIVENNIYKEINNIYLVDKNKDNSPIILEFISLFKKQILFKQVYKLKNTGVSIANDLSYENRKTQKELVRHLRQAKQQNLPARIRGTRLEISSRLYTIDELNSIEEGTFEDSADDEVADDASTSDSRQKQVEQKRKRAKLQYSPKLRSQRIAVKK
nr:unnamed protein product [Callosobruchus analis]